MASDANLNEMLCYQTRAYTLNTTTGSFCLHRANTTKNIALLHIGTLITHVVTTTTVAMENGM